MKPFDNLADARGFLERRVFDHFRKTGEWPKARDFDLKYRKVSDQLGGLHIVCQQIGYKRILCGSPDSAEDRVRLQLAAIADLRGSEDDAANFLAAVRLAAERITHPGGRRPNYSSLNGAIPWAIGHLPARRAMALLLESGVTGA